MIEELRCPRRRAARGSRDAASRASSPRRSARSRRTASTPSAACRCPPCRRRCRPRRASPTGGTSRDRPGSRGCRRRRDAACASAPVHSARSRAASSMSDELSTATTRRAEALDDPQRELRAAAAEVEHARRLVERQQVEQPLDLRRRDRVAVVVVAMRDRAELLPDSPSADSGHRFGPGRSSTSRHGATRKSSAMPGSASTVHNRKKSNQPMRSTIQPVVALIERARHRREAREQRELRRRVARVGRARDVRDERRGAEADAERLEGDHARRAAAGPAG